MNLAPLEQDDALGQRTPPIKGLPGNAIFLSGSLPGNLGKVYSRIVNPLRDVDEPATTGRAQFFACNDGDELHRIPF